MALKFRAGDAVAQVVTPITGTVQRSEIIGDQIVVFVQYTDALGQQHERPFLEGDLQPVTVATTASA